MCRHYNHYAQEQLEEVIKKLDDSLYEMECERFRCNTIIDPFMVMCLGCGVIECQRHYDLHYNERFNDAKHQKMPLCILTSLKQLYCNTCNELIETKRSGNDKTRSLKDTDKKAIGIYNLGNTCFLSSVLQSLLHCDFHKSIDRSRNIFSETIYRFLMNMEKETKAVVPDKVYNLLDLNDDKQHDSHEILLKIFSKLCHCRDNQLKDGCSPYSLFGFEFIQTLECHNCSHKTRTASKHELNLQLNLLNNEECNLESLINKNLNGIEAECPKCKDNCIVNISIKNSPDMLICHLSRVKYSKKGLPIKSKASVRAPVTLDLAPWIDNSQQQILSSQCSTSFDEEILHISTPIYYSIYSIICHTGDANAGHYYMLSRYPDGERWKKFDDHVVTYIDIKELDPREIYMIFYKKWETKNKIEISPELIAEMKKLFME